MTPRWVPLIAIITIHDRQISRHGGAPGMRDRALLEGGLARPLNRFGFGETSLHGLAANYAFGIAKAHAFVDGNKRTAFVTAITFLGLNGVAFSAPAIEVVKMMEDLASAEVGEEAFAEWLRTGVFKNDP